MERSGLRRDLHALEIGDRRGFRDARSGAVGRFCTAAPGEQAKAEGGCHQQRKDVSSSHFFCLLFGKIK